MGFFPIQLRVLGVLVLTGLVLPLVRRAARRTLSQARSRYRAGRTGRTLSPRVSRLDPAVLSWLVPLVSTGRLLRRLVAARPMGP
ncbi:MAG: hypothetical protein ABEL97_03590 [Salinibacter sp.]